jgi:hypothetical protein
MNSLTALWLGRVLVWTTGSVFLLTAYGLFCIGDLDEGQTTVSAINRFVYRTIPRYLNRLFQQILPSRLYNGLCSSYDYLVNQRNPFLQIFYLLMINGAFIVWLIYGDPLLPCKLFPHRYHSYIGVAWVFLSQYTFYLASTKSPGIVDEVSLYLQ